MGDEAYMVFEAYMEREILYWMYWRWADPLTRPEGIILSQIRALADSYMLTPLPMSTRNTVQPSVVRCGPLTEEVADELERFECWECGRQFTLVHVFDRCSVKEW